jgi:recombination protein RecA
VTLENGFSIKVSREHKFYTNAGWVETQHIRDGKHAVLCDTGEYSTVSSVKFIGQHSIVDITVDDDEHAYFGNGMLNHNSGKSLIAAHMMANVQKEGGVAVLLDTENAVNPEFFRAVGLDLTKMVYATPETVEDIFTMIEKIIETVRRRQENNKKIIIVVDSVAAVPTKQETEANYDKDGYATGKAIILSKAMRKITHLIGKEKIALVFTNQLRQKLNAPAFSDPWTTSGGKAIAYHASTRLRLALTGKIKTKAGDVLGVHVKASVVKNRLGPPHRVAEFDVYFDRGIDDLQSWLSFCKSKDVVKTGGAYFTYTDNTGADHKMQGKDWSPFLSNNPELKTEIYNKMVEAVIMSYSSTGVTPDDIDISDGENE